MLIELLGLACRDSRERLAALRSVRTVKAPVKKPANTVRKKSWFQPLVNWGLGSICLRQLPFQVVATRIHGVGFFWGQW